MHIHRLSPALLILTGSLLAGCGDDETAAGPSTSAESAGPPVAALVGAPNTWEKVGSMPTARYSAVAGSAVNANGRSIVYVFGGSDVLWGPTHNPFGTVEAYNIASDRWSTKSAAAPFALSSINGVAEIGGKLYLPGGEYYIGDGGVLRSPVLQCMTRQPTSGPESAICPSPAKAGCPPRLMAGSTS